MRHRTRSLELETTPLTLTKAQFVALVQSPQLVARMLWAARHQPKDPWVRVVRAGSCGVQVLVDRQSAYQAYERLLGGDMPPELPSQARRRISGRTNAVAAA